MVEAPGVEPSRDANEDEPLQIRCTIFALKASLYAVTLEPTSRPSGPFTTARQLSWHRGIPIGGDGAGEKITVDARDPRSVVTLTPCVSLGWVDSLLQCACIDEFVDALEAGTFDFKFG
jgi:hypothetical protein